MYINLCTRTVFHFPALPPEAGNFTHMTPYCVSLYDFLQHPVHNMQLLLLDKTVLHSIFRLYFLTKMSSMLVLPWCIALVTSQSKFHIISDISQTVTKVIPNRRKTFISINHRSKSTSQCYTLIDMSLRHAPVWGEKFQVGWITYMHFSHKAHTACCARDIGNLTSVSQNVGYFHQYNTKIVN